MINKKIKILFFHFDLGYGGAERVLVNLVNNLNPEKYDVTITTLFHFGVAAKNLRSHIKWMWIFDRKPFRGITHILKLFPPVYLHRLFVRDKYDIEIAFEEGSPTRIISGCRRPDTKKYAWIHVQFNKFSELSHSFRSKSEVVNCYNRFDAIAGVSKYIENNFSKITENKVKKANVVYNTLEIDDIVKLAAEPISVQLDSSLINLCSVGRLNIQKGYERLMRVLIRLKNEGISNFHFYLLGTGELADELSNMVETSVIKENVTFLGYQTNPHKYVSKMDFFVCSSYREGYSTAVTESVINQIPVLTTDCSGMSEILMDEAGLIVSNDEDSLYEGLKLILTSSELRRKYKAGAVKRSDFFSKEKSIEQFEKFIGV